MRRESMPARGRGREGGREVGRCYAVGLEDGRGAMSHTLQVAS